MNSRYMEWLTYLNPAKDIHLRLSYLFLQQADLLLTVLATSAGFTELNPFMAGLIDTPQKLYLFKVLIPLLVTFIVPGKLLIPAIVLLAVVIGWDVKELLAIAFV